MSEGQRLGRVSIRERRAWLGQADVAPPGAQEGRGVQYFCFVCIDLHSISDTPLLADM